MTNLTKKYDFTFNGETRQLTANQIKKWTGCKLTAQPIGDSLEFIEQNKDNPKFKMLTNTLQGIQVASGYRLAIGKAKSIKAARAGHYGKL